jgi:TATA-box binding protein (TBP) (component of TFIID and TFIIIB)
MVSPTVANDQFKSAFLTDSFGQQITSAFCGVQRFAAVIMRIREPKTTALIFASGKMVLITTMTTVLNFECQFC